MKRHLCRHCGLALDTYAELTRHVASHSTPAVNEHTYSVVQPIVVPPSDQAKRTKYSCKCDATFGRWMFFIYIKFCFTLYSRLVLRSCSNCVCTYYTHIQFSPCYNVFTARFDFHNTTDILLPCMPVKYYI